MAYVNAGAQYVRQVSGMLKDKVNSLRTSSLSEVPQGAPLALSLLSKALPSDALKKNVTISTNTREMMGAHDESRALCVNQ